MTHDCTEDRPCAECEHNTALETLSDVHSDPLSILRACLEPTIEAGDVARAYIVHTRNTELRRAILQVGILRFGEKGMLMNEGVTYLDHKQLED